MSANWQDRDVVILETERLVLRPWRDGDLDPLARIFAKPEVWWFPLERGLTYDETSTFLEQKRTEWATRGWSLSAAALKDSGDLIGFIGLSPPEFLPEIMPTVEVGWRLDPDHWGHGLATEGARAVVDFGFRTLELREIVSIYQPANVASGRIMEKLGMTVDRDTKHPVSGIDLRVQKLLRGDWHGRPSSS